MIANQRERWAIVQYLAILRDARAARQRLFERACEEPYKVMRYLDSMPARLEEEDDLKRCLRTIATSALNGRTTLLSQR